MDLRDIFTKLVPGTRLNRSLRILITLNTIFSFVVGLFAPFYAVFVIRIGGNLAVAGFSWALFSILTGTLILLFSAWGLKMKEQELLIALGYLLRGVAFASYAFMSTIPQLIITQIVWAVGAALGTPAFDATYSMHTIKTTCHLSGVSGKACRRSLPALPLFLGVSSSRSSASS